MWVGSSNRNNGFAGRRDYWRVRNPRKNSLFERSLDLFFNLQNFIRRHVP
jgi:hypothetical protein